MTYFPKTGIYSEDSSSIDAFGRWRTSQSYTVFDSKQLIDKDPNVWAEHLSGSVTSVHTASLAQVVMTVPASNGACVVRQTKMRFDYSPAKSNVAFMTGRLPPEAGTIKRLGQFDSLAASPSEPYNGIFFEMSGTIPTWNIALTGGITQIKQEDWNVDRLDGTGASGVSASFDHAQIWNFDYEWLGVGRVRCGLVIDGKVYYNHYFNHANNVTQVYMGSPNLPLRYQIMSTGGAGSMSHICSALLTEDGLGKRPVYRTVSTKLDPVDANTANTYYAIAGYRLSSTNYNSQLDVASISILEETKGDFHWVLAMNPVLTGSVNWVTRQGIEVFSGSSVAITAHPDHLGRIVNEGYRTAAAPSIEPIESEIRVGVDVTGSRDTLVLFAAGRDNLSDFLGSIKIRESV